jgi:hypothetical protein
MRRKSLLASALCALALSGLTAAGASAGEVTGNGKPTAGPSHARSICVFSGQNDNPGSTNPMDPGGRVQSYGFSFVRNGLKGVVPNPGIACNPTRGFEE